jgi:thiamine-phosphate pyrophosphorylase
MENAQIFRIFDVNLNRLREALRVIEEYFRFLSRNDSFAVTLKKLRHSLEAMEADFRPQNLLENRDIATDPFAYATRPEEMTRTTPQQIVAASFKRSQEAARVIEEYAKVSGHHASCEKAKEIRFALYAMEKEITLLSQEDML